MAPLPREYHISAGRQHRPSFGEDSGDDIDQDAATDAKEKPFPDPGSNMSSPSGNLGQTPAHYSSPINDGHV